MNNNLVTAGIWHDIIIMTFFGLNRNYFLNIQNIKFGKMLTTIFT